MRLGLVLVTTWAIAMSPSWASAQSAIDAPVSNKPTVGSEIRRGRDAVFDKCDMDSAVLADVSSYETCVTSAETTNRQAMSTGFEPFALGVYFQGWYMTQGHPDDPEFAASAAHFFRMVRAYERQLHLTDRQLLQGLQAPPEGKVATDFAKYASAHAQDRGG